jgi:16S rRNA (guanine(966)-N(2))-methyltransferase RsmD
LFSILGNRLPDCRFLDLYAGTGAIAIEAVSRGASRVTCVESEPASLKLLHRNTLACGMVPRVTIRATTVKQFLARPTQWDGPYDIVFADPPYAIVGELQALLEDPSTDRLLAADAWLVVEHAEKTSLPSTLGTCTYLRRYRYGDTALSLYSQAGPAQS